jgi:hypothetical protein
LLITYTARCYYTLKPSNSWGRGTMTQVWPLASEHKISHAVFDSGPNLLDVSGIDILSDLMNLVLIA